MECHTPELHPPVFLSGIIYCIPKAPEPLKNCHNFFIILCSIKNANSTENHLPLPMMCFTEPAALSVKVSCVSHMESMS